MSRRLADDVGDSAGRLSCVYGGQWKRAFRVNTRVVHSAVLHRPPIGRRSLYTCVLHLHSYLRVINLSAMSLFCVMVLIFHGYLGLHSTVRRPTVVLYVIARIMAWLFDFTAISYICSYFVLYLLLLNHYQANLYCTRWI